jgi:hypothetical protein
VFGSTGLFGATRLLGAAGLIGSVGFIGSAALIGTAAAVEPPASPTATANAATFDLFTANEAKTWNATQPPGLDDFRTRESSDDGSAPTCHSTPDNEADNPTIRILEPALDKPLATPLDINLQFVPTNGAPIRPETFRVCYLGLITMDITKRITDRAAVTAQGIHVTGAKLPSGRHKLLLIVADEHGRLARHEADFYIQ